MYENKVQEPLEKERTKTARQKYQNNAAYASYRDIVWVGHPEPDTRLKIRLG